VSQRNREFTLRPGNGGHCTSFAAVIGWEERNALTAKFAEGSQRKASTTKGTKDTKGTGKGLKPLGIAKHLPQRWSATPTQGHTFLQLLGCSAEDGCGALVPASGVGDGGLHISGIDRDRKELQNFFKNLAASLRERVWRHRETGTWQTLIGAVETLDGGQLVQQGFDAFSGIHSC